MREICTSGSMSGEWKRSMAELVRHRQTKEPVTDRPRLNHRATPRLYLDEEEFPSKPEAQARGIRVALAVRCSRPHSLACAAGVRREWCVLSRGCKTRTWRWLSARKQSKSIGR